MTVSDGGLVCVHSSGMMDRGVCTCREITSSALDRTMSVVIWDRWTCKLSFEVDVAIASTFGGRQVVRDLAMDMKLVRSGRGVVVQVSHADGRSACSGSLVIQGHELITPPENDSSDLNVDKHIHDDE